MHYARLRRLGKTGTAARLTRRKYAEKSCKVKNCGRKAYGLELCEMHYARLRRTGDTGEAAPRHVPGRICKVNGCTKPHSGRGYCNMHLMRVLTNGAPGKVGPIHDGSGYIKDGYRIINKPGHPNANAKSAIAEHVYVMSNVLNRPIVRGETVHHKNGIRHDNEPSNLELWTKNHPSGQRVSDRIDYAIKLLRQYAPDEMLWPADSSEIRAVFMPQK